MKGFLLLANRYKEIFLHKKKHLDKNLIKLFYSHGIFFFPISFIIVLLHIVLYNYYLREYIIDITLENLPIAKFTPVPYPQLKSVLSASSYISLKTIQDLNNSISAKAAIVIDGDSKVVLLSKNANLRFSMASTTKIMSALVALEYFRIGELLTVKTTDIEGVVVGFKKGEKVRFEDMLYAMLLPSGNDAALAIAQNYKGGVVDFVGDMNKKAMELGLYNTHFSDPTGLDDNGNYTTALDLARLSSYAMQNEVFSKIVATKLIEITTPDGNTYILHNLNKLLNSYGVDGIKTGFTYEAEGVLVTSKKEDGHRLVIVVMKSKDRFVDTKTILDYVSGNIVYKRLNNSSISL